MRNKETQMWIPLYVDKWIFGSTRLELEPDERGVFVDLLALAAKDEGYIRANENMPYPLRQLAGLLNITEELLLRTIEKCKKYGKIEEKNGILKIVSWERYQFSDRYKRMIKAKSTSEKTEHTSEKAEHTSEKTETIIYNNIEKNNIEENNIKENNINNIAQNDFKTNPSVQKEKTKTFGNDDTVMFEIKLKDGKAIIKERYYRSIF